MNDDLKETLQTLSEWKKELDVAVPEIVKTAKQIMMSPEMQTMIAISNKARILLPEAIKRFAELAAPYAELAKNFTNNLTPILGDIARISLSLSVIARLGIFNMLHGRTSQKNSMNEQVRQNPSKFC